MPKLTALSGLGVKGPACFLYEAEGRRLLLDLGQGPDDNRLPPLEGIGCIDAILFSHGHADHTGGLALWESLGKPPLFATRPVIALTQHEALKQAQALEDRDEIFGLTIETGPCGHAPGAVWMRLGGEAGLVYSGDMSLESTLFRACLPPRAAALVYDASYGVADAPLARQQTEIEEAMNGPVLFPCPAGGRGLEMALYFLEKGYAVSLCPSHRQVAETLLSHQDWLAEGGGAALEALLARGGRLHDNSPIAGVMIAAGPNAERGVAKALAARMVQTGEGQVIFTGHIASGQPSGDMVKAGKARFMRWNVHPRFCEQKALMEAVQPKRILAAFCLPDALAELKQASGWPLCESTVMEW